MTRVYRAYSPSKNRNGATREVQSRAQGDAATFNQGCLITGEALDWTVQQGTVSWNQENK